MPDVTLGNQRDYRSLRINQGLHLRVVLCCYSSFTRSAEGNELGIAKCDLTFSHTSKELGVLRQCTWPAAFNESDPKIVQQFGDGKFVFYGIRDAFTLGSIAQGGVVYVKGIGNSRVHQMILCIHLCGSGATPV